MPISHKILIAFIKTQFRHQPFGVCTSQYKYRTEQVSGFTKILSIDWARTPPEIFTATIAPAFPNPRESHQPTLPHKFTQESILYNLQNRNNPKCLNIIPATISTPLIPTLLTMCGITIQQPTRNPKFWPGYLRSHPRDGTTTSESVGSKRWEAGFWKLRNIKIGLVALVGVSLMVQPCFAMEVPGLGRPTLGKRRYTKRERYY